MYFITFSVRFTPFTHLCRCHRIVQLNVITGCLVSEGARSPSEDVTSTASAVPFIVGKGRAGRGAAVKCRPTSPPELSRSVFVVKTPAGRHVEATHRGPVARALRTLPSLPVGTSTLESHGASPPGPPFVRFDRMRLNLDERAAEWQTFLRYLADRVQICVCDLVVEGTGEGTRRWLDLLKTTESNGHGRNATQICGQVRSRATDVIRIITLIYMRTSTTASVAT